MPTYTQIGTAVTVGSGGAAAIDFTSIPSTYTDLILKLSLRSNRASQSDDTAVISLNGSTTGFTLIQLQGDGSSTSSATSGSGSTRAIGAISATNATANVFANTEIYMPNYALSTNKSFSVDFAQENNQTATYVGFVSNLWSNTSAITSITITSVFSANFVEHSTAYLYGVSNA